MAATGTSWCSSAWKRRWWPPWWASWPLGSPSGGTRPGDPDRGSYSCHQALWAYYDLRAFLTVTPQLQRRRIRERNGEEGLNVFLEKWIPLEEAYFAQAELERRCDYLLELECPGGGTARVS